MPTYMDIHDIPGVKAADVVGAHEADLKVQGKYGVNYKHYWVDEMEGKVFCLVMRPTRRVRRASIARRTASRRTHSTKSNKAPDPAGRSELRPEEHRAGPSRARPLPPDPPGEARDGPASRTRVAVAHLAAAGRIGLGGAPGPAGRRVCKAEEPRLVEQRATTPGGGHAASQTIAEPAGGGTDVTVTFDYEIPGGFVGDLADKLFMERALERDLKHSNENFKALCEAGPGPRLVVARRAGAIADELYAALRTCRRCDPGSSGRPRDRSR